ncbi:MAG: OmpH family outer membrane protein [Armatimonadetes bacterium]|nr:OmpH family outer membrane protein [Armatimonadota bacterium]
MRNSFGRRLSNSTSLRALKGNLDMMSRCMLWSGVTLALAVLSSGSHCAYAQQATAVKIGSVNADRLWEEFPAAAEKQKELDDMRRAATELLQTLNQYTFLPAETFAEVVRILRLPKPLPKDMQERLDALLKLSAEKDLEFRNLRAKTNRTPEEEDKFRTLQDLLEARQRDMEALEQQLVEELLTKQREYRAQVVGQVREAIGAVARAKGYDLVLDSFVVLYGGDDLTDAVLAVLSKSGPGAPAAPAAPAPPTAPAPGAPQGEGGGAQGGQ